ncbi:cyclic nucleotide-binding domain protein [Streptomyces venezuelae]|uniref:Crp/Fnr family transcriptional regulator n=1 Tax=Streptomyces gardneri TaxID=66892 RepID=UPI0006BC150F|nr:Crp/Fnr family transcriptional regulator [Streptomyces gardneri]ALO11334.1 cyclic nucleotide-binding domain protein [Streptomyces venezuelae]QPK48250.1 Crp/Fnr family transcriptional regulator [Streptomyces gardneri]WRK39710.1 Crp/Fnr family transcriptional regulator [Streptomyces venezuelae]CUM38144.1 transcriptional regulator, Crp/Fnr family [Streptomyces venezuelae]
MQKDATSPLEDESQFRELESLGTPVTFQAGQTIFAEGHPSHTVLLLKEGHVIVSKAGDGSETLLATRGPGVVLGDEGVLMSEVRSATIRALTDVSGVDISADKLIRFINEKHLWPGMYRSSVMRRRESDEERTILARHSVKVRLARWLVTVAEKMGEQTGDNWLIDVAFSQQDIASRIGSSREGVATALRHLREEGLVSTGRQTLTLHDIHALRATAQLKE